MLRQAGGAAARHLGDRGRRRRRGANFVVGDDDLALLRRV